jgi:hypothetical protein
MAALYPSPAECVGRDGTGARLSELIWRNEPWASGCDSSVEAVSREARMADWHDQMVDRPDPNDGAYAAGWTVSGLAVLGAIVAVWVFGI